MKPGFGSFMKLSWEFRSCRCRAGSRRRGSAKRGRFRAPSSDAHRLRALRYRLDDVLISGAAAEVAFQALADFLFRAVRMVRDEVDCAHHHAGRAEAALQAVTGLECGL